MNSFIECHQKIGAVLSAYYSGFLMLKLFFGEHMIYVFISQCSFYYSSRDSSFFVVLCRLIHSIHYAFSSCLSATKGMS